MNRPEDVIIHDIINVKRQWILSCYGLNLTWKSGTNILHGDFSPEELRCEAYAQFRNQGDIKRYIAELDKALREVSLRIDELQRNPSMGLSAGQNHPAPALTLQKNSLGAPQPQVPLGCFLLTLDSPSS